MQKISHYASNEENKWRSCHKVNLSMRQNLYEVPLKLQRFDLDKANFLLAESLPYVGHLQKKIEEKTRKLNDLQKYVVQLKTYLF